MFYKPICFVVIIYKEILETWCNKNIKYIKQIITKKKYVDIQRNYFKSNKFKIYIKIYENVIILCTDFQQNGILTTV